MIQSFVLGGGPQKKKVLYEVSNQNIETLRVSGGCYFWSSIILNKRNQKENKKETEKKRGRSQHKRTSNAS